MLSNDRLIAQAKRPAEIESIVWYIHDYWLKLKDTDALDWDRAEGVLRLPLRSSLKAHSDLPRLVLIVEHVESVSIEEAAGTEEYDVNTLVFDQTANVLHVVGNVELDLAISVRDLNLEVRQQNESDLD